MLPSDEDVGSSIVDESEDTFAASLSAVSEAKMVHNLIRLQNFNGYYSASEQLWKPTSSENKIIQRKEGIGNNVWATMLVVIYLEERKQHEKDVWAMVAEKAK